MIRLLPAAVLGACLWAASAYGQFYSRPPTNPLGYGRSPYSPYSSLYYGNPAAIGPPGAALGYGYGGYGAGIGGSPAFRAQVAPGAFPEVAAAALGSRPLLDPNAGWVTGHPVRWQAYRSYFQNPMATLAVGGTMADPSANPALGAGQTRRFSPPGKRPDRGKENLKGER